MSEEGSLQKGSSLQKLGLEWLSGGLANALASAILNPMDVAKTRMQVMYNVSSSASTQKLNLRHYISLIYAEGGVIGLWRPGLSASMAREMLYSGPRAGFYVPIRDGLRRLMFNQSSSGQPDASLNDLLVLKVTAALITGTLGALIANPVDVVKIRMMIQPKAYPSLVSALQTIHKVEGARGLYKGLFPSTLRGAFIAVGELTTYDHSKSVLKLNFGMSEGFALHTVSSLITGLVATTVAAPFDLLKSRLMFAHSTEKQSSLIKTFTSIIREEGILILFRGWLPAYLRLGPHALICFPIFENIRRLFGLDYI